MAASKWIDKKGRNIALVYHHLLCDTHANLGWFPFEKRLLSLKAFSV